MENYPAPSPKRGIWQGKDEVHESKRERESREERKGVWFSNARISFKIYNENAEFNAFHLRTAMFVKDLGLEIIWTY
jgi:hypothetical protein